MALKTLASSTLDEVLATIPKTPKGLVTIPSTTTQLEALNILGKNDILAAPVTDEKNRFIGIVNRRDLVTTLAFNPVDDSEAKKNKFDDERSIPDLSEPVGNLLNITRESSKLYVFKPNDVLPTLLDAFSQGVHRALVGEGENAAFIDQFDVARFLHKRRDQLDHLRYIEVKAFRSERKVGTLKASLSAIDGFRSLLIQNAVAAPVVDDALKLVTTLSLSDVRRITRDNLKDLFLPIPQFLNKVGVVQKKVNVVDGDVMEAVLIKMLDNHIHQVWVMEGDHPIGAVSLTDICSIIYRDQTVQDAYTEYKALVRKNFDLLTVPLGDLVKDRKAATVVSTDASQREVLRLLSEGKFLSVPVRARDGNITAIIDVSHFFLPFLLNNAFRKPQEVKESKLKEVLEASLNKPISAILPSGPKDQGGYSVEWISLESKQFLSFSPSERLHKVLEAFSQGHHRVIVSEGEIAKLYSQSDLVAYLHKGGLGGEILKSPVENIVRTDKKLKTVTASTQTLAAFRELLINNHGASPVIIDDGRIVGTLSISDLRGLGSDDVKDLLLPLSDYLKKKGGARAISIAASTSLSDAISLIVKNRVHRAWITDAGSKPLGVLSLTDIIKAVLLDKLARA